MKRIYLLLALCTLFITAGCTHLSYCNFCGYYDSKFGTTDEVLRLHHNKKFSKTERYSRKDADDKGWKLTGTWRKVDEHVVELTVEERWHNGKRIETSDVQAKIYYMLDLKDRTFEHASFSN